MQSQEGMSERPRPIASDEHILNTDPREQGRDQASSPEEYTEHPYEEGYAGMDSDDIWAGRNDEKLRPKATQNPNGLLLLITVVCGLILVGMFIGIILLWLSWLLLTALITTGIILIILNWRTVRIPMPIQRFSVSEHPQLIINETMGTISIRRGESGVVNVAPMKRVSGVGVTPENMRVDYNQRGDSLNISTQVKWNLFQFGLRNIDLEITVPENCDVRVKNGSGRIDVEGLNGNMHMHTGSGKIHANDLRGNIDLKTGSGSISGSGLNGQLALVTGSGSIHIQQATMTGASKFKTGSGTITFDGDLDARGSYDLRTGSGSIQLSLAPDASFQLQASTGSGRVTNEFDGFLSRNIPRAFLKIKTGSGSVRIYRMHA